MTLKSSIVDPAIAKGSKQFHAKPSQGTYLYWAPPENLVLWRYLIYITRYFDIKRLTDMADLSGFRVSEFDVLSMTYLNSRFAP